MTIRVFTCPSCSHRLRLGSARCGRCYMPTLLLNRWSILIPIAIILMMALLIGGMVLLVVLS